MRRTNWLFRGSILLVLATVAGMFLTTGFLDKAGRLGAGRINFGYAHLANCGAVVCFSAPLFAHVAACARWRHDRRPSKIGFMTVAGSCGITLWGNVADYVAWSRLPPPTDQVTYLAGFFAMLGSWGVCTAYIIAGFIVQRIWPARASPGPRPPTPFR